MYLYVFKCIYMCLNVFICIYVYLNVFICRYMYLYVFICIFLMYLYVFICMYVYVCICMYVYTHLKKKENYTYVHTCMHACMHAYMHDMTWHDMTYMAYIHTYLLCKSYVGVPEHGWHPRNSSNSNGDDVVFFGGIGILRVASSYPRLLIQSYGPLTTRSSRNVRNPWICLKDPQDKFNILQHVWPIDSLGNGFTIGQRKISKSQKKMSSKWRFHKGFHDSIPVSTWIWVHRIPPGWECSWKALTAQTWR